MTPTQTPPGLFDFRVGEFFRLLLHSAWRGPLYSAPRRIGRFRRAYDFQKRQSVKRLATATAGTTVPPVLIASVTRACNLNCTGCYSKVLRPEDGSAGLTAELSDDRFMELFREAIDLGVGVILVAGGEPLMRRSLLAKMAKLPDIIIPVFTNGTLIDGESIDLFTESALVPVFSIEGETKDTARRRGRGIHEDVFEKAEGLRARGFSFGFSITVTSQNFDLVLSRQYLDDLARLGPAALFLVEYVPVAPGTQDLALSSEQKARWSDSHNFKGVGYPVIQLPGNEEDYGGCLAAGRGFIHLAPDGRIEACPFAAFSDSNADFNGLAMALDSPLMRSIRDRHGELTETSGACALWNKAGWIASLTGCAAVGRSAEIR
ncbi:MAG: radical SAM protein [Spirochaetaceae bacterium]|nr:radical SAM protein [Spirochaetaceae bacterium]